ncbi:cation:proton antiporter [Parafannyhessea umbonata]|uniref:cation:proton antiporter n=1 Tax=Parafannyhessea umbonata TaxID=604330 RepID=UPI00359CA653
MEQFEFILVVLACVGLSSVLDHVIEKVSLPVLQVMLGLAASVLVPGVREARVESELFLVLFIAPLLFNETREVDPRRLWQSRADILSLAVGLVVASALAVGYALHRLVPSIPLAAAFALGGALGPTDAAAVTALKSSVNLSDRQTTLLSGESLINDASGVVAFQFAVAAAVTGSFSPANAAGTFLVLFVGGIVLGAALGAVVSAVIRLLEDLGLEDVTSHALYELMAPFLVYLVAEALHVSGILAVVAAGIVMAASRPRFHSTFEARRSLVSGSLWSVVSFLINGTVFVLLGMQLPHVAAPGLADGLVPAQVLGVIVAVAATSMLCRLLWVYALEVGHRRRGESLCGRSGSALHDALVTTVAGAKGAVTLSIALTLPATVEGGAPFVGRDLLATLAAGVILVTLLAADAALPRLAPQPADDGSLGRERRRATMAVLEGTAAELAHMLEEEPDADHAPAVRFVLDRYLMRMATERLEDADVADANRAVEREEFRRQAQTLNQLHARHVKTRSEQDWKEHVRWLRFVRHLVGYQGRMEGVVPHGHALGAAAAAIVRRSAHVARPDDEEFARVFGQACIYAIELEYASLDYFDEAIAEGDAGRAKAARIRRDTHEQLLRSLWSWLNYGRDVPVDSDEAYALPYNLLTHEFAPRFGEHLAKAREYARDVDATALRIELDVIARLQAEGQVSRHVAGELREDVYLLQMSEE